MDLGSRRIGVAYSDSGRSLASPWGTIERSGDPARDRAAVVDAVREMDAVAVVVGLPLSLSGRVGPAARAALQEADDLRRELEPLGVAVETADERLTTVEAQRSLRQAGRTGRSARRVIDSAAAMVLLQAWLDRIGPDVTAFGDGDGDGEDGHGSEDPADERVVEVDVRADDVVEPSRSAGWPVRPGFAAGAASWPGPAGASSRSWRCSPCGTRSSPMPSARPARRWW